MHRNLQRLWVGLCLHAKGLGVKFVKEYGSPAFLQGENHDTPTNGKRHPFATIAITSDGTLKCVLLQIQLLLLHLQMEAIGTSLLHKNLYNQ